MGKVTVHNSANLTSAKCLRAGFLSSGPSEVVVFALFVSVIAIIPLTIFLRETARPSPKKKEAPVAAATETTEPESGESENAPPPYAPPAPSPPATEPESNKAAVDFPNPKDTAPAFVRGTIILALLVLALVTIGFGFQYLNYCPEVDPEAPLGTWSIIGWCFFVLLVLFASSALVSWGLLCWYVCGGKKQDFMLDIMSLSVFVGVGLPFYALYMGAVELVRGCQKWFCGVTFEEEEQDGVVEAVETDVEMQRLMKGDNDGDDYDEEVVVAGRS
ncbi:hypothetical protein V499_09779 [Pseudogymnoascus sp. VKM F-103]|uniref:Uncharacterized protein n=1 Tax=Pseudogymnoascus verrucosus TaxID=342668 RepID=A0A1B8GTB3_9PEZI|nr:uncharacterized protein VE01_02458 [Pseudogymnoascus verrucosus]KFY69761.1 hypothetical protein V499_09779 [Pseudogymnoascus sp. VKM F-103]OBT99067.1 hypothetical protein VE01_02458 [Pseudogymnoascus verrucosus]